MKEYDQLDEVMNRLLAPDGCPWDQQQTMQTLRESVLEETCELIEAVDLNNNEHIVEELGDLLLNWIFFCKIGEKENKFHARDVINLLIDKLIRRHPHIFGDAKVDSLDELWKQWHAIKASEKGKDERSSVLDGIPKGLPALARAQKMLKKMEKKKYPKLPESTEDFIDEEELGEFLYSVAKSAQDKELDAEQALRSVLAKEEKKFRHWEST